MRVKKQQLELNMEQHTGSKLGKEIQPVHPEYSMEGLMLKLKLQYLCKELTHLKRPLCEERLKAGGEGNGYPLQYSYMDNPMDRGTWQAVVHGVTKSRT